jgi:uncharacterized protein YqhQ
LSLKRRASLSFLCALWSSPLKLPTYGGQAVIEGVMMRGKKQLAVAVRNPKGEIVLHTEALPRRVYDSWVSNFPFLRGLILLWDMLILGMKTLMFSANVSLDAEDEEDKVELGGGAMYALLGVSMAFAIGLFFVVPLLLAHFVGRSVHGSFQASLLEGGIRIALFIGYLALMGRMPDIRRTFMYHGAEHKTINAFEDGSQLEPAAVKRYSTIHPRCGTTLLLFVLVIAIFVFAAIGTPPLPVRIASRIVFVPLIAALCYEWIRFAAKHIEQPLMRAFMTPAMALQRLTTREPTPEQLEVSIAALQSVIAADGLEAQAMPLRAPVVAAQPA